MDKLLYVPNPLLRQKADKIQSVGIKEKKIAKKMMQIMIKAPGVGLAANQIGILKQIVTIFFVDQETKKETQYTLFNPNIVSYSQEKIVMEEGCLSLPEQFAEIERPQNIVVEYLDENNKHITKEVSGSWSRTTEATKMANCRENGYSCRKISLTKQIFVDLEYFKHKHRND